MFTGIIETVGSVEWVEARGSARQLRIAAPAIAASLAPGDSVAVDGVCLTVERADAAGFVVTAVEETLARTTLGERAAGNTVNLERAATMARLFGGHIVQGHVDGVARVAAWSEDGVGATLDIALPASLHELCVEKGSIAVDGISLTIASMGENGRIRIAIVPHTLTHTSMPSYLPGRLVNVEVDVVAKYVRVFVKRFEVARSE